VNRHSLGVSCNETPEGPGRRLRALLLTFLSVLPVSAANQILLRNLPPSTGSPQVMAADRTGHLFVISSELQTSGSSVQRIVKLDLDGARLAAIDIPQAVSLTSAATDSQGNVIVAGSDFSFQGIVLKLDPNLREIRFSRTLPGLIRAVAVDAAGNIYVTGNTSSADFPTTVGAFQTKPPSGDTFGKPSYAFLTVIAASGDRLLYSTFFGGDRTRCEGGSACIGVFASTSGTAIAVDPSGAVVIAGSTTASDLPVTPGALAGTCNCGGSRSRGFLSAGFAARLQPSAPQQLQWATYLNAGGSFVIPLSVAISTLALDSAGNVILGGQAPAGLPTTAGALQPAVISIPGELDIAGFLIELNSSATAVRWGTYFGGTPASHVSTLALDPLGRIVFTGVTIDPSQPAQRVFSGQPGSLSYVARLSADGAALIDFYAAPAGLVGQDLAITSTGGFAAMGAALWIETGSPGPSLLSVVNSASQEYAAAIAPVEIVTLFGIDIGPRIPANGRVEDGAFTSTLEGTRVLFDEVSAPLLYAGPGQINAVVPRGIGPSPKIRIVTPSGSIDGPKIPRTSRAPAIFQNGGIAAAVNPDGTINSFANPAKPGSIVSIFVNGAGLNRFYPDGALIPPGVSNATANVWVVTALSLEVDFAGDAPGLVSGVMQVNFRVPERLRPPQNSLTFNVIVGGIWSNLSLIAVAP
jgi:uncharacterized protein (TIGR03437 family)